MAAASDGAALRRVTLRAPVRDPLLARQRLERALAAMDWTPPGLPRRALLLVRHLVATGQRAPALGRSIAESLRAQAREARRPWVDGTAAGGGAVWFADDDELAACLLREWLHGRAQESWWTRAALGDEALSGWLARRVMGHGDRIVAVIAQLASIGLAAPWIARLDDATAHAAVRAIARDHGAPAIARALETDRGDDTAPRIPAPPVRDKAAISTPARIAAAVPELGGTLLAPAGARLLVAALVAARDPALLRSVGLAQALQDEGLGRSIRSSMRADEAGEEHTAAIEDAPESVDRPRAPPPDVGSPSNARNVDAVVVDSMPHSASRVRAPRAHDATARAGTFDDLAVPPPARHDSTASTLPPAPPRETIASPGTGTRHPPTTPQAGRASSGTRDGAPALAPHREETTIANAPASALATSPESRAIDTSFGGLFYLLNAAIGLGLYGDFTAPDQPGIEISPWTLLAIAGDAWFGKAFPRDAIAPWLARMGGEPHRIARPRAWSVADAALRPWGEVDEVHYRATAHRLRLLHPAGFVLFDVPRSGAAPAAQAAALCRDRALLVGARLRGDHLAQRPSRDRWRDWLLPLLRARLARALGVADGQALLDQICRAQARVTTRPAWVDVALSLAELPVAIRLAGLDRDPGWIPAGGRDVRFHFE